MECKLFRAIDRQKEFEGILKDYSGETITIETDGKEVALNRDDIAAIRLAIDF